jgi:hypothetical protein
MRRKKLQRYLSNGQEKGVQEEQREREGNEHI